MDTYEATKTVLSRIQSLDPENASKIMGYILIQDQGDKEMIRLAFGPETVLISLINQVKNRLGLSSNSSSAPSTPSSPSPFIPVPNPNKFNPFPHSSPRIIIPNNGFQSLPSSPWSGGSPVFSRSPRPVSYASVVNGPNSNTASGSSDSSLSLPFFEPSDEYCNIQVQDQLSFLNESFLEESSHQSGVFLGGSHDDNNGGFGGWKPCMYYARGFCKNGNSCKFLHDGFGEENTPSNVDYFDEILRVKALQQRQRFMASGHHHHHPFGYNRSAAAALMTSGEFYKYGRSLPDRNEFSAMALGGISNSSSRQIYLTFPADSTFKEEDVSNYFSMYGPVQDVRIPYQQKRMFGFVTFVYPETVKIILAKGNPHFVCDSRVLVKPYKEKGKFPDKKQFQQQQQPIDRGELESGELYDIPFGARMFHNSHAMMLRRKIEHDAELQQAIELQGRRLMNLQLMKNQHHNNHFQPSLSPGVFCSFNGINQEVLAENKGFQEPTEPPSDAADDKVPQELLHTNNGNGGSNKEQTSNTDDSYPRESLEHILPDNLFTSPTKSVAEQHVAFSIDSAEADVSSAMTTPATTPTITTNSVPMPPATSALQHYVS
ncbi:zinc finger CCCH domain-containing protein 46 [Nicotiana tabacum]|uniref:Zinc finger CCCH domain-containing protein 53 n=1 Tax=Nicotiana tabacum TaxID=4097 RepID=A0A1S4CLR9_TOBAC|nr:PREDICTED: zinc finger CCCH domain-containing protein 53-like [Nicotiana tabacum]XP_016502202.1 PREDICTED: zinc finger CCCH domain-containing protein 53-like [Nicotiana tabacum]